MVIEDKYQFLIISSLLSLNTLLVNCLIYLHLFFLLFLAFICTTTMSQYSNNSFTHYHKPNIEGIIDMDGFERDQGQVQALMPTYI